MAPPWMRVSERWSQRSLRSLRMVCAETSKRRARSSTDHPAEGAGDVENFSLAVGQSGHGGTCGSTSGTKMPLWCG